MRPGRIVLIILSIALILVFFARWKWFPSQVEVSYRFVLSWGSMGSGPGEFNQPIGIATKGNEVFVSDGGNDRIQVFNREGKFIRMFGKEGEGPEELSRPVHIDIRGEKLYVAEYMNDRIHLFSLDGKSLGVVGSPEKGAGKFDAPSGVAVDNEGRMYVADFYNHRVVMLDERERFVRQYGKTGVKSGRAAFFNYPTDVALLPGGNLVVADAYNDRIQVFKQDGTFLEKWGGPLAMNIPGSGHGWFRTATGVGVGKKGNIYVADFYNNRVQKFTKEGKFLVSFGSKGTRPGQFDRPTDVAVDDEGYAYVVDFGNNRIQKFTQ